MPNYAITLKCLVVHPGTEEDAIKWLQSHVDLSVNVADVEIKKLEDQDAVARFERGEP